MIGMHRVGRWSIWVSLGLILGLGGCAFHMPPEPHSVAYYAARIPPPPVAPVASAAAATLSTPISRQVRIVVSAADRRMTVYQGNAVLATFPVAIGFNGAAPRRARGDDITPVGHYRVGWINYGTRYGTFMGLTYPNREDAAWGLRQGIISRAQYDAIVSAIDSGRTPPQNTPLGGAIGIHGMGPQFGDAPDSKVFPGRWTAGCVALSNWDVQQLAALVKVGTPVEIVGEAPGYRHTIELSYARPTARANTKSDDVSLSSAVRSSLSAPAAP